VSHAISTSRRSGGTLSVGSGVTLGAALTLGAGSVTLNGGGTAVDVLITSDESLAGSTTITASRDIVVRANLATTGSGSNLSLTAGNGSTGAGAGGVWVDHNAPSTGQVTSAGTLTVSGKDLFASAAT